MKRNSFIFIFILFSVVVSGCVSVGVKPIQVEPIKIEITVKIQIEKDLSDFFDDIDKTP